MNRPAEDVVVAQLRFKHGLEMVVHINGLGDGEEAVLQLYGYRGATNELRAGLLDSFSEGLQFQYRDFAQVIGRGTEPVFDGTKALSSQYCVGWIHQSARQEKELVRRDVLIE